MDAYKDFLETLKADAYHEGEIVWEEDGYTVTRTHHYSPPGCHNSCGVLLYVKDGKLERVEGDPLNPFVNGKLCVRCLNLPEATNHEQRVKYPLKRAGERGENKWERVSWEEALDIIEEKVREIWRDYGPESIFLCHGTGRNINWQKHFLGKAALGTPNISTIFFTGFACYIPRVVGTFGKIGDFFIADASMQFPERYSDPRWEPPGVIVVWGNEPLKSNGDGYMGHWLVPCTQRGSRIISIDPRLTWWGARADYFLQIRPGTDSALALAMLNIIIKEDLYDHDFVEYWCSGFDELTERVSDYSPEWAASICGLNVEDIYGATRLYAAAKSASVQWGLAFDQQLAAMTLVNAVSSLVCITGNLDIPGGNVIVRNAFSDVEQIEESDAWLDPAVADKKLINEAIKGAAVPICPQASSDSMLLALETGKPYPIQMLWIESTNAIACAGMDAPRAYEAMKKCPFVVVADPYITPAAVAVGDIILPVAMSAERDSARNWWTPLRSIKKASEFYEAKSDEELMVLVGKRLNPAYWDAFENGRDWVKKQYVVHNVPKFEGSLDDLDALGGYAYDEWNQVYKKYEKGLLRPDGQPGFLTPTGRVELKSLSYDAWGLDSLPFFIDAPKGPLTTPELMKEYPLILSTGGRSYEFFHSENREQETMRELHPWPLLTIHNKDAEKYGISDGEWVWVENEEGRFRQLAFVTQGIKEGVIHAEHGWWFPESEAAEPNLYGTFDSNPNNLTVAEVVGQGGIGSPIKSTICKVYPFAEGDVLPGEQVTRLGGFA